MDRRYYSCRLNDAVALMVPGGMGERPVVVYSLPMSLPGPTRSDRFAARIVGKDGAPWPIEGNKVGRGSRRQGRDLALESLARRKLVLRSRMLGQAPAKDMSEDVVVLQPRRLGLRLTPRRQAVVDFLEEQGGEATLRGIRDHLRVDRSVLSYLAASRVVVLYSRQARRDPLAHRPSCLTIRPLSPGNSSGYSDPIERAIHDRTAASFSFTA